MSLSCQWAMAQSWADLVHKTKVVITQFQIYGGAVVQLVFSQCVPLLEVYSQLQLSHWGDPITFSVPKSTWWFLLKIQGDGNLAKTQMNKWWNFEHFLTSRTKWKSDIVISERRWWQNWGEMYLCTANCHK